VAAPVGKRVQAWYERLTLPRAVGTIVLVATILGLAGGALVRVVEPATFTSIGLAYWWSVETITTVGYGDVVPVSTGGRAVGAVLMLTGLSLIPTLSSVVVSLLITKRGRAAQEEDRLSRQEQAARLARIEERLAALQPPERPSDSSPPGS
jgi:voltage-gated potassium channel